MGGCVSKGPATHGNRVSSSSEIHRNDSLELSRIEEIKVPDVTSKHNSKSISLFAFTKKKSFISLRKTTSLQSAVSSTKNGESDQLNKQIESLKGEHEKERKELSDEKDQLQAEVNHLRSQVKFLNSALAKLQGDKGKARIAERDALERATAFEQEKDKIQRTFKMFREAKEKEVQDILKEKQNLLDQLRKVVNSDGSMQDFLTESGDLHQRSHSVTNWLLDNQSVAESYLMKKQDGTTATDALHVSDFKTNKDIISVLHDLLSSLHQIDLGVPSSRVYSIYVDATPDMNEAVQLFFSGLETLLAEFEMNGRLLYVCHFPPEAGHHLSEEYESARLECVKHCNVFVGIIGNLDNSSDMITNVRKAFHSQKVCLIASLSELSEKYISTLSNDVIINQKKFHLVHGKESHQELVAALLMTLTKVCKLFLDKQLQQKQLQKYLIKNNKDSEDRHGLLASIDMFNENEQLCIQTNISSYDQNVNFDEEIQFLNSYIVQDGPVQPLLVTGEPGSGKSSMLSQWVTHLRESFPDSCILYHVVSIGCSYSKDPIQLIRRFSYILLDQIIVSTEADKEFLHWLDIACNKHANGIIMVIDGADLLENNMDYLKWLLDPLPVPVRIIISVSSKNHPKQWLAWPQLPMSHDTENGLGSLKSKLMTSDNGKRFQSAIEHIFPDGIISSEVSKVLSNHLFRKLVVYSISNFSHVEQFEEVLRSFSFKNASLTDLYSFIISHLCEKYNRALVSQLLTLLYVSCNGFSAMELSALISCEISCDVIMVLSVLKKFQIVVDRCGLIQLARIQVEEAIVKLFSLSSEGNSDVFDMRKRVVDFFMKKLKEGFLSFRVADELPVQLRQSEQKDQLRICMETYMIFIYLYKRGQTSAILSHWKYLGMDINDIHEIYMGIIKQKEMESQFDKTLPILCDTLGEFMYDRSQYKLAHTLFEKSLELKEAHFEPDDMQIGQSFLHLGRLFIHWKKFQTAEDFYKQALEIKEQNNEDHDISYAKLLDSLAVLYVVQERSADADSCRKQASSVRQNYLTESTLQEFKSIVTECRTIIDYLIREGERNEEMASYLTGVGLVYFNLHCYEDAAEVLERAKQLLVGIVGYKDPLVGEIVYKISMVYQTMDEHEKAETLLQEALPIFLLNYPVDHASVQRALKSLVKLYKKQKKSEDINKIYRKMIEIHEQHADGAGPSLAHSINVLAVHLSKMGQYEEALQLYQRALQIYNQHLDFHDFRVSEVLSNMAKLYYDQGELSFAAQMYKLAMDPNRTNNQWEMIFK